MKSGVLVKLLHLWLPAALIACGLCPVVQAGHISPQRIQAGLQRPLHDLSTVASDFKSNWFRPVRDVDTVFRAQSDDFVPTPPDGTATTPDSPTGATVDDTGTQQLGLPAPTTWNAFSPPVTSDPFLNGGNVQPYAPAAPMAPGYGAPMGPGAGQGMYRTFGANGGRPYRFGWEQRLDSFLIPNASVSGGGATGNYDELGVNYDLVNTQPFIPGWILRKTAQFRWRSWDGPRGGAGLPGSGFRFGEDFEIQTPAGGPHSISLGITPSINTDFNRGMTSDAFQLDGRGIIWWQLDSYWSLGLGAMYWDRVDDRVLPYGGLVYRDDFWEWRLTFPEAEVRLFLGNEAMWSKWLYFRAKYNVEAYEGVLAGGVQSEFEIEDWQLTGGFQMDAGYYRWFIEAGVVLDREIDYGIAPDIGVDTAFISRIGVRY
jgi:hypothetical protein